MLLFNGENINFGNPVDDFKSKLVSGKWSREHVKKMEIIKKHRKRKRQITVVSQCFANLSDLVNAQPNVHHPSLSHEVKRLSRHAAKKMKSLK